MDEQRRERSPERAVLIHVGYHKAGSTWLQQVLFADRSAGFQLPFARTIVNERIVAPKELLFDADRERAFFGEAIRSAPAGLPVLSNERFSGNPHSGGWDSRILADRLAQLFPSARVLLVIREQQSAIRSVYLQYVREGGTEKLASYLAPPSAGRLRRPLFDPNFFAYHTLIDYYQQIFGRSQVLVLPYELLADDALAFAAKICAFCGVDPPTVLPDQRLNVGLSPVSASLKRSLNKWLVRDALNPTAPLGFDRANQWLRSAFSAADRQMPDSLMRAGDDRMRRRIAQATAGLYQESNEKTAQLTGIDLASWGYAL